MVLNIKDLYNIRNHAYQILTKIWNKIQREFLHNIQFVETPTESNHKLIKICLKL